MSNFNPVLYTILGFQLLLAGIIFYAAYKVISAAFMIGRAGDDADERKKYFSELVGIGIMLVIALSAFAGVTYIKRVEYISEPSEPLIFVELTIIFSSLFLTLLTRALSTSRKNKRSKELYPKLSIVSIIRQKKLTSVIRSNSILLLTIFLSFSFNLPIAVSACAFIISLVFTTQVILLDYRIKKDYYGRNEYEAREIIDFITSNYNKIDLTGPGGPKKIISDEDLEEMKALIEKRLVLGV